MGPRVARAAVAGLAAAVSLSVGGRVTAQPGATPAALPDDTQIRTELRRLNATKTDCLAQAQQMLAAQQAASAGGRLAEVDQLGQTLKDKMVCVDRANQDLIRLQIQLGPSKSALFASEDRFHQEYRQGLHAQLASLQWFSEQLADPDASRYDLFAQQVEAFRRQVDVFKNRYIRLLNEAETRELARAVFQATDLLMASVQTWKDQLKAEAAIAELAAKGPSAQLARAHSARDAAVTQRGGQWEAAQRLISQAAALAATR
jgi:hypothetical protein